MTHFHAGVLLSICALAAFAAAGAEAPVPCTAPVTSPEGRWHVQDEQGLRAVVDIEQRGAQLVAVVREIVLHPGEPAQPRCDDCSGAERGKPIRGLEILWLARGPAPGTWEGTVLDPEEGRRYHATAALAECGQVFELRGYVLLPVFGRVERWKRAQ